MERSTFFLITLLSLLVPLTGCGFPLPNGTEPGEPATTPTSLAPTPAPTTPPTAAPPAPTIDYFREATNRATSAVVLGQSAQSPADWQLAVGRWQQAIDLMKQVPTNSAHHAAAQTKIQEYQRSLATAQQRATEPAAPPQPERVAMPKGLVAQIPIRDRRGGTPIVDVTFQGQNGRHTLSMLFDTGASGTLITAEMADQIGVVVVGNTQVKIADGSIIDLPIGYVDVLEVGGLHRTSMVVAIGGSVGLLGQDVYGEYGIAIGSHVINLHP